MNISQRARKAIFQRLEAAAVAVMPPAPDIGAYYRRSEAAVASGVEGFIAEARKLRAEVIETDTAHWGAELARIVGEKKLGRLLAGRGTCIADALRQALPAGQPEWFDEDLPSFKQRLFADYDAGITTAHGAIAATGSLVLWPDRSEPRSLSLVPPVHIAILRASDIHDSFIGILSRQGWAGRMPSNALLISGPSKTADIQRILAYGAHGPRELVILLLRDETTAGDRA